MVVNLIRGRDAAEALQLLEFTPKASGLTRSAWRSIGYEPGSQASVVRTALAESDVVNQLATGPVVVIVGRANLAEDPRYTMAALHEVLYAVPGGLLVVFRHRDNIERLLQGTERRLGQRSAPLQEHAKEPSSIA